jgi:hypothetical protein
MSEDVVPNCIVCGNECSNRFRDKQVFYYEGTTMCGKCYHTMICSYCDKPTLLSKCDGHAITKNPNNRFMKDKEFVAGMRFEYESNRHLDVPGRPVHVRHK